MKLLIVMVYTFCIGLLVLAGYMMKVHQQGPGWVITAAVLIAGSVSYKENKTGE